jgi:hypothetical protein
MVKFNPFDFNLEAIRKESKLFNLRTTHDIRVYGLKNEGNPVIKISVRPTVRKPLGLCRFLNRQGIHTQAVAVANVPAHEPDQIKIGLRRDLRSQLNLCSACLQTIVYYMERRLRLPAEYVIPGVPVFPQYRTPRVPKPKPPQEVGRYNGWLQWQKDGTTWQWVVRDGQTDNSIGNWVAVRTNRRTEPVW